MPRSIDMRHDVDRPASRPWLIGSSAGVLGQRVEPAADAGIGAKQRNRAELPLGLLDDVADVFLLPDIAFECRAVDQSRDGSRSRRINIGDDDPRRTGAMKGFAERAPNAFGAAGDNHDFVRIAQGLGCDAVRVTKSSELAPALQHGLAHDGVSLIEVVVDSAVPLLYTQKG